MIIQGRSLPSGYFEEDCDVCIVGSGTSGAIVAREMALEGKNVVILEEGPYFSPEEKQRFKISDTLRHLFRGYGATFTLGLGDTPPVGLSYGWGVGGSSVLTGGCSFRTPEPVLDGWVSNLGLKELEYKKLEPFFEEVEEYSRISPTPRDLYSGSVLKFEKGTKALGYSLKSMNRNMKGCRGCGRCNFVCPHGAKTSVDLTYIPEALDHGARLYSDCRADTVTVRNSKIHSIEGKILGQDRRSRGKFVVRAKVFVLAMSAVYTPAFLLKNRICKAKGHLGKHLTIHPAGRVYGLFDENLKGYQGAEQPVYLDKFKDQGILINSAFPPINVVAPTLPGIGKENWKYIRQHGGLSLFGAMISDEDAGRVVSIPGREPLILYRLKQKVKALFMQGITALCEIYFAAGAKEVLLPFSFKPVARSMDEIHALSGKKIKWRDTEMIAQHPLGSARMGTSADHAVVDQFYRTFEYPNLFIVDGSIIPTSIGVNPQETIMALALRAGRYLREEIV